MQLVNRITALLACTSIFLNGCAMRKPEEEITYMRQVLQTPISQDVQNRAAKADEQYLRTGVLNGQPVIFVNDYRHERLYKILDKITQGNASKFTLRIVDTTPKIENAFVTGSSFIYVFTGLIDNAQSDDELAFVLGHELAHVRFRHLQRHDNSLAELGSLIASIAAATQKDATKKSSYQTVSNAITGFYSRDHEREADAQAVIWTQTAGYKATESFNFFQRMISKEREVKAQNEARKQQMMSKLTQLTQTCQQQAQQLQINPNLRTPQNQQTVLNNCNTAAAFGEETKQSLENLQRHEISSLFTRTHPSDQERITYIDTLFDYTNCRASEQQLAKAGRGWYVFKTLDYRPICH